MQSMHMYYGAGGNLEIIAGIASSTDQAMILKQTVHACLNYIEVKLYVLKASLRCWDVFITNIFPYNYRYEVYA